MTSDERMYLRKWRDHPNWDVVRPLLAISALDEATPEGIDLATAGMMEACDQLDIDPVDMATFYAGSPRNITLDEKGLMYFEHMGIDTGSGD